MRRNKNSKRKRALEKEPFKRILLRAGDKNQFSDSEIQRTFD
jgi:hypothetical protein